MSAAVGHIKTDVSCDLCDILWHLNWNINRSRGRNRRGVGGVPHAACHTRMLQRVKWVKNAMAKIKSSAHKLLREEKKTKMSMPISICIFFASWESVTQIREKEKEEERKRGRTVCPAVLLMQSVAAFQKCWPQAERACPGRWYNWSNSNRV